MVSLYEADNDTYDLAGVGNENKTNNSYLVVSIHGVILWDLSGVGRGGAFLACDTYGSRVTVTVTVTVLSVHLSWFCLLINTGIILFSRNFHLLLDPMYRVFPASHTKHSVSLTFNWYLVSWYQRLYYYQENIYQHMLCSQSADNQVVHGLQSN